MPDDATVSQAAMEAVIRKLDLFCQKLPPEERAALALLLSGSVSRDAADTAGHQWSRPFGSPARGPFG